MSGDNAGQLEQQQNPTKMDFKSNKFRHHLKWFSNILYLCLLYLYEFIYFNNMQHQIGQSDCRAASQLLPDVGFQPTKIASIMRIKPIECVSTKQCYLTLPLSMRQEISFV